MKRIATLLFVLFFIFSLHAQNMWINELHYDNASTDAGEFVEVVVPTGTTLSQVTLTMYNGNGGVQYDSHTLDTFTEGSTVDGFTIYSLLISGIQNGSPDGLALDNNGTLIQFLSYEGTFTGVGGPADGVLSTDIGVSETSSTPVGESLQLLGSGTDYSDFTWGGPFSETPGLVNSDGAGSDQALPVELLSFRAISGDEQVTLNWRTASETGNQGYIILRSQNKTADYNEIDSYLWNKNLRGAGTSTSEHNYSYTDLYLTNGVTYWYKLVDVTIDGIRSENGTIKATPQIESLKEVNSELPKEFSLLQNTPNPFNPTTKITFDVPESKNGSVHMSLIIYNLLGQKVVTLYNGLIEAGRYEKEWNGLNANGVQAPSGIYIYQLTTDGFNQARRMVMLK